MNTTTSTYPSNEDVNLLTCSWIPVIKADGRRDMLSLLDLFASAHEIRDLAVRPHEKIALLRLLICITQAALDGPETRQAWKSCRAAIQPAVKDYLPKWRTAFELFGEGMRFSQLHGMKAAKEEGEGSAATKLDLTLASGNNASLFDNGAGDLRPVSDARLALTLLTFQCFSPGGRIGVARWNGADTPGKGSSNHAPCTPSSMLHSYLLGDSLLETLHLNLLNRQEAEISAYWDDWGRPVWEMPVTTASDKAAIANATNSYLGRLVPLSRSIRLEAGGRHILLANGLDYPLPSVFREPAATFVARDDEIAVMGISLGRSIWRQLAAITVKRHAAKDRVSGPLALNNLGREDGCTLWIGALATDKAKIEDVVEASYAIPAGMFQDAGHKLYEEGIELANQWQSALSMAVKTYASKMKLEPVPYDRAKHHFWTLAEQHVSLLLQLTGRPEEAGDLAATEWGRQLKKAAHEACAMACPHQTPRQIEAYAQGLQQLFLRKPKDPNAPASKRAKSTKPSKKAA